MIYFYVQLLLLYIICVLGYVTFKHHIHLKIRKHINPIQIILILIAVTIIGSPFKLKSTSISGKTNFSSTPIAVKKTEADPEPLTQNLQKQYEELKKQQKETENAINDN
jgi:uncharacterized membrane protein YcgQ (UPF0703/DUF1980 family)